MSGKVFSIQWGINGNSTNAKIGAEGVIVGFSDGTNWVVYQLASKSLFGPPNLQTVNHIALGNATIYAASDGTGDAMDWTAITRVMYAYHRTSVAGDMLISIKNASLHGPSILTGGGVSLPSKMRYLEMCLEGWGFLNLVDKQGTNQILGKNSVQIGDGSTPTYFKAAAASFEFPEEYSATGQYTWNADSNSVELVVKALASDTISLAAGVMATDTPQVFKFDAASSGSASYPSAGFTLVGFDVTLDTDIPLSGATFSGCSEIVGAAADLTNCVIEATTSTDAAHSITANGAVLSGCTTDVTNTSAAYHLELGTSVTAVTLTNHTFTGTASTDKVHVLKTLTTVTAGSFVVGVHYRINTVGSTDFTLIGASANTIGVNFTATGVGSGTGTADQAVKITISGTTSLAEADCTTAGAPAWVAAPAITQVVVVSGFTAGSRIQIYDTTSSTELFNGTASAGNTVVSGSTATWTDPLAASATRAIRVRVAYVSGATAKLWQENTGLTCGVTSGTESITYPITQVADTTYNSNAIDGPAIYATSGITFTDAATDLVNINIAADTVALKTIYACFVYWLFTAAGIDDDVAYIDGVDPANYILTSMKIRNTSTDPLKITGGYFYDSTGSVENCVDVAGSSGNIYPMPEHVVPYQTTGTYAITGSLQDALDAIADVPADVLAAAATTPIRAKLAEIESTTSGTKQIEGAGTEADPWGPSP